MKSVATLGRLSLQVSVFTILLLLEVAVVVTEIMDMVVVEVLAVIVVLGITRLLAEVVQQKRRFL